jgi:hypothetical protein
MCVDVADVIQIVGGRPDPQHALAVQQDGVVWPHDNPASDVELAVADE